MYNVQTLVLVTNYVGTCPHKQTAVVLNDACNMYHNKAATHSPSYTPTKTP